MQDRSEHQRPRLPRRLWLVLGALACLVLFMYVSIVFKIVKFGP